MIEKMELIILTGQSGAGKSRAIEVLEDIGFYCIDNVPPGLLPQFARLLLSSIVQRPRVAVVTDVRGSDDFSGIFDALSEFKEMGLDYKILYLEASSTVIINRFKETRRSHPLQGCGSLAESVMRECEILQPMRQHANYILDTTHSTPAKLKERLVKLFLNNATLGFLVQCCSFGFKYGPYSEADIMFDVRCLPNPYHDPQLRHLTGMDKPIKQYVLEKPQTEGFLTRLLDMTNYLLPLYNKEGKSRIVIAIGCTGGKHRSVTLIEELTKSVTASGYKVITEHRDIHKG